MVTAMNRPLAVFLVGFLSAAVVYPAAADTLVSLMTAADQARLKQFDTVRRAAIDNARANGDAADVGKLEKILTGKRLSLRDIDLAGNWRCRTIKMGDLLPVVIYGWFNCRIDDAEGWRLRKVTGSQRTTGRFFDDGETRMIYVGTLSYNNDGPKRYGTDPDRDQIGVVVRPAPDRLRIEFPLPRYESKFDILELRRAR